MEYLCVVNAAEEAAAVAAAAATDADEQW